MERATLNDVEKITDISTKAFNDEMNSVLSRDGSPPGYNTIKESDRYPGDN